MNTTTKKVTSGYTAEQSKDLQETFTASPTKATIVALSEKHGKSTRSIIAKLVNLHVYVLSTDSTVAKAEKAKSETKDSIVSEIAALCNVADELFASLTGASKKVLVALRDGLRNKGAAPATVERANKVGVDNLPAATM